MDYRYNKPKLIFFLPTKNFLIFFDFQLTLKRKPKYEPTYVEITPRSSCIQSKVSTHDLNIILVLVNVNKLENIVFVALNVEAMHPLAAMSPTVFLLPVSDALLLARETQRSMHGSNSMFSQPSMSGT